ncbi:transglycosylase SLT domain-containing protein [Streptomyces sp. B21-108]|uniref:transglycosylase SLT domain-containing protein n=1 Tax=Streptomyces sp. B21-108 TaxID=3039419 RepID=UPI002FF0686E
MAVLTQSQIVQVARSGGLPGDPEVWAAIAMAESSGRTDVVNSIGCVGLWQINQPVWVKTHPTWTAAWLKNPVNNAKAAAVVFRAQGYSAWEGYTGPTGKGSDGPWKQYYKGTAAGGGVTNASWWDPLYNLDPFGLVPGNPNGSSPGDPFGGDPPYAGGVDLAQGGAEAIGTIAEAVQKSAVWLGNPRNWIRIGYVAGGAVLVAMGLSIVAKPLMGMTPGGAVVKKATKALAAKRKPAKTPAAKKPSTEQE